VNKHCPASFTARLDTAVDAGLVEALACCAVDLAHLEHGGDEPDVCEGDVGELTAELSGDADTTAESGDLVAQTEPEVEAGVGEFPDAVDGVSALGLT